MFLNTITIEIPRVGSTHFLSILKWVRNFVCCTGLESISLLKGWLKNIIDGEYVKRFNIWFDIGIIFKTIFTAFRGKGEVEGKQ